MYSQRFDKPIIITNHAALRMQERQVNEEDLLEIIDTGELRYKDKTHLWAFKNFPQRSDNLLCAVLVLEDVVVIKTVMHHFVLGN